MAKTNNRYSRRNTQSRRSLNSFTTHSGNTIRIKRTVSEKRQARKNAKAERKARARATLPQNFFLRQIYRLNPKRVFKYWFSRDGAIMAVKVVGVFIVVCFVVLIGLFAYFRKDLPKLASLDGQNLGGSISFYDRTGKILLWQDYNAVKRTPVPGDQMSPYLKQATVAIEDQNFYKEGAFNIKGIARAGLHDILGIGSNSGLQGASTITQQLVKLNENWIGNRTIATKVKETILAVDLNREYTKDQILAGYLNIAPYGNVEYGCESASEDYFHTSCKDLTLAQSAFLAAIPQSPSYYSPYSSPEWNKGATQNYFNEPALIGRKNYVLDQMAKLNMITQQQADEAKKVDVMSQVQPFQNKYDGLQYPYFVLTAEQQLENQYGSATVKRGGWKVITTLDTSIQDKANQIIQDNLPLVQREGGDEEAMVIEDVPTGQVVGLVGGTGYNNGSDWGELNYASGVQIQPGSAIKPYVYGTLINNSNAGAGSVFYDSQGPIIDKATGEGYPCTIKTPPNAEGGGPGNCLWDDNRTYPGPMTIRYALGGSRNVPAVKAFIQAGPKNVINTMTQMMNPNATQPLYNCYANDQQTQTQICGPAAGIGGGAYLTLSNQTNGLATFARMGQSIPQTFILKITDSSGKVIDQYEQPKPKQVINPQTAYIINNILSDPRATYFPYGTKIQNWNGWNFAIKTGTTNNNSDFIMEGYSTQYAVVSWAGYHSTNKPLTGSSDTTTFRMTAPMMEYLHQGKKPVNWQEPKGIQHLPAYVESSGFGMMFGAEFPSPSTDIYPSWYKPKAGSGQAVTIDKVSGKLATQCTPPLAKQTIANGSVNGFSIDQFYPPGGASNFNGVGNDNIHSCDDTKPTVTLTITDLNNNPISNNTCDATKGGCIISATVTPGTAPIDSTNFPGTLNIQLNGNNWQSAHITDTGQPITFPWTPSATGQSTFSATIIDSELYSGSDSITVNTIGPSTNSSGCGGNNGGTGNSSGGNGTPSQNP